jgi:hypothetical protein
MATVRYTCVTCGKEAIYSCQFPLMGSKQGQTCARSLCKSHCVKQASGKALCLVHSRFTQQRVVVVKEAEKITFVVPPERQLPPTSAIPVADTKQDKKKKVRIGTSENLADIKRLALIYLTHIAF